jgi:hypothetical protein
MGFFATGHRLSPRFEGPIYEWNHDSGRFANVSVLATWTLFDSEFWPNRFKRLSIRPNQSENFGLGDALIPVKTKFFDNLIQPIVYTAAPHQELQLLSSDTLALPAGRAGANARGRFAESRSNDATGE